MSNWRKSTYSNNSGGACVEVATWRKSSYSNQTGGNCVEAAAWRKSTYSNQTGGACVEVATADAVLIRDTTNRTARPLTVSPAAWTAFLTTIK